MLLLLRLRHGGRERLPPCQLSGRKIHLCDGINLGRLKDPLDYGKLRMKHNKLKHTDRKGWAKTHVNGHIAEHMEPFRRHRTSTQNFGHNKMVHQRLKRPCHQQQHGWTIATSPKSAAFGVCTHRNPVMPRRASQHHQPSHPYNDNVFVPSRQLPRHEQVKHTVQEQWTGRQKPHKPLGLLRIATGHLSRPLNHFKRERKK